MNSHKSTGEDVLPVWVTIVVVLTLTATFVYSVVAYGPDGYPIDMMTGGLLGAYAGTYKLIQRNKRDTAQAPMPPPPAPLDPLDQGGSP